MFLAATLGGVLMHVLTLLGLLMVLLPAFGSYAPYVRLGAVQNEGEMVSKNTITFVGDVMLARAVERAMLTYGSEYPFQYIADSLTGAAVVANFEAAVPQQHVPTPDFQMRFSVAKDHLTSLATAGVTHVSLANNHSFDYGVDGFYNTESALESAGLQPFGNQRIFDMSAVTYVSLPNATVAIVGINAVDQHITEEAVITVFADVAAKSDIQIAYLHWGVEYEGAHHPVQERLARMLVTAGADAVIGNHPHVVQDIALYDGVPIFYSIGNFVFDQYFSRDVQQGLVLTLSVASNKSLSFSLLPVTSEASAMAPQPMDDAARNRFLHNLAIRSDPALFAAITGGVIAVDTPVLQFDNNSTSMSKHEI